jgi:Fe2+ transport system protein FeoA
VRGRQLIKLIPGERGSVTSFAGLEEQHARKLLALGVFPGMVVEVLQVSPTLVIRFEHTQLALDREIASRIYVTSR